jgi:hypothetical protein
MFAKTVQHLLAFCVVSLAFAGLFTAAGWVTGVPSQKLPTWLLYTLFAVAMIFGFEVWGWLDRYRRENT